MKTKFFIVVALIVIIGIAIISCKQDPTEQPQKQPDTTRSLVFGTDCKVTISSDDTFTDAEWKMLCDKVVEAIEKGYNTAPNDTAKNNIATFFKNHNVSVVLLKSATFDCEVKASVPNTMYFKANASTIDGLTGANLLSAIQAVMDDDGSYPTTPSP